MLLKEIKANYLCPKCGRKETYMGVFYENALVMEVTCPKCRCTFSIGLPENLETCSACNGSGSLGIHRESCWYCGGIGKIKKEFNPVKDSAKEALKETFNRPQAQEERLKHKRRFENG